jgi:hypothetical protein
MALLEAFESHLDEFLTIAGESRFIVFLCGPNLASGKPSAHLRLEIKQNLESEGFEVVLGEDEGLDDPRLKNIGVNTQDNEVEFISKYCNAVIIIADSVGSFCELGLFSWHFVHEDGAFVGEGRRTDCILLLSEAYKDDSSYLNQGPAAAVNGFGMLQYVNYEAFNGDAVIKRLKQRRGVMTVDNKRGRPRKASP